ncbi:MULTISPECIES: RsmB/NOP family class I SAM-dependent RNA methyltransferase [Caloramator]|uniref:16S rRNA (Cytosine1407-C5)-methyltransferase n=1 Tax=Caloramator proteoclasticus DSM 10124 TaxID=1121262 RepID=A0A1M4UAW9_9CLOT|nr:MULTISPECIES: RsmB/NOP family class I SAM-dependent RNA methyltransferase [Caloramator]SHE53747.1 16S rRNA (cytosine1407-C5)-methyltransferase [Caloramator proteoclasticus DSM 10124]
MLASISDVKRRLPEEFIDYIYEEFSVGTADKMLYSFMGDRYTTLRVNTLKYDISSLMEYFKSINIKFDRVQWYKDALIIKNADEKSLEKLDIYKNGYIYIQSLPSMIPPLVLDPQRGEKILDMTAAPGSKTTQMAAMMNNEGYILANELDKIRCERLKYNVELQGASIVEVVNGRGEQLGDKYPEEFDRVLLDAPCSGEGRFNIKDVKTYRFWSHREVNRLSNLQRKLFLSAYKALKKGGIMVYSTCTLNRKENEEVLDWALNNLDIEILNIDLKINGVVEAFTDRYDKSISKAIRVLPSKELEGFFVCKIKKN